jgi:hypothetical protein
MNAFFPVGNWGVTATTSTANAAIPSGGPMIRIARETSTARCWIKFGTSSITVNSGNGMELVSGVVEELENPNDTNYTHFAIICDTGTCGVNLTTGPRYKVG